MLKGNVSDFIIAVFSSVFPHHSVFSSFFPNPNNVKQNLIFIFLNPKVVHLQAMLILSLECVSGHTQEKHMVLT